MISSTTSKTKRAVVRQAVASMNKTLVPSALAKQFQSRLQLPEKQVKRIQQLYNKVMEETITPKEEAELDTLMDVAATMDVIRTFALFGPPSAKRKSLRQ
jgi:hypothetical protein